MKWARWGSLNQARIPIFADLCSASWPNWREALKEIFVILFFSLMPLWLGLLIVNLLTISDGTSGFITKFASSSDLGILSASLLGPMLYMMFREDDERTGDRIAPGFPSGLWFIMLTVGCCMVATAIYCFTYLSGIHAFFDKNGSVVVFVNSQTVASTSWSLFVAVVALILCASTIRNSMETQPARMMSADTEEYVSELQAAQGSEATTGGEADTDSYISELKAAQGGENDSPA
jgi:hypothetical protein